MTCEKAAEGDRTLDVYLGKPLSIRCESLESCVVSTGYHNRIILQAVAKYA
jgi:hypothetical protein